MNNTKIVFIDEGSLAWLHHLINNVKCSESERKKLQSAVDSLIYKGEIETAKMVTEKRNKNSELRKLQIIKRMIKDFETCSSCSIEKEKLYLHFNELTKLGYYYTGLSYFDSEGKERKEYRIWSDKKQALKYCQEPETNTIHKKIFGIKIGKQEIKTYPYIIGAI